ncbi:hypothetical protein [Leptolyngbya sp. PCC 6406]|uniref:hypothetical protein n=1 Tax=Leptolyngbya sp. PCC 6406 TaxID=1173264 RepID=UPI0002ABD690|nr:hypothetical protein [Leptolyngbya sp. PCC 6406]
MTWNDVLVLVRQFSVLDQVRLIERIAPEIEQALQHPQPEPKKSLWGLCTELPPLRLSPVSYAIAA